MNSLAQKKCQPCKKNDVPLTRKESLAHLRKLPEWQLNSKTKIISREWAMKNFLAAVALIKSISKVAEAEDHHPDLHLTSYRYLKVELSTHAIGGLSENDFILAAKIDSLPKELKK